MYEDHDGIAALLLDLQMPGADGFAVIAKMQEFLPDAKKYMKVEVQFRTIAMDLWASLEHKLKYKKDSDNTEEIERQLKVCADSIEALDYQMQEIRDRIDHPKAEYSI